MKYNYMLIILFFCASLHLVAQSRIFDFETKDSLTNPILFQTFENKLFSFNYISIKDTSNEDECDYKYLIYNLHSGKIEKIINPKLFQQSHCYRPSYMYQIGDTLICISNFQTGANNRVLLSKIKNESIQTFLEIRNDFDKHIIANHVRPFVGNSFYKLDFSTNTVTPYADIYELFKLYIVGDSLKKELIYSYEARPQLSKESIVFDNEDYFASIHLYRDILEYPDLRDSLSMFEIFRLNKETLKIDTLAIENNYNYEFIGQIEISDILYFLCYRQDRAIKNKYVLDNDATLFSYDIKTNTLSKVKDLTFSHKVEISKISYDSYTGNYYLSGAASTIEQPEYDNTFSDYWVAMLDNQFNIKGEFVWSETDVQKNGERVNNIFAVEDGLILLTGEYNLLDPNKAKSGFYKIKRDLFTSVSDKNSSAKFSFYPNPTRDYINLSVSQLPYTIKITAPNGKTVLLEKSICSTNYKYDLRGLAPGIYFISINGETKKFLLFN